MTLKKIDFFILCTNDYHNYSAKMTILSSNVEIPYSKEILSYSIEYVNNIYTLLLNSTNYYFLKNLYEILILKLKKMNIKGILTFTQSSIMQYNNVYLLKFTITSLDTCKINTNIIQNIIKSYIDALYFHHIYKYIVDVIT